MESGQQFGLYVIRDIIETGENQSFYCAEDPFFNREVALKLFSIDQFSDKQNISQLENRLERLAVLDQLSIAPIYDSGSEDDNFYYTSAFFNTGSLSERIKPAAMDCREALTVLFELTQALDYAQQQGVELNLPSADGICFDLSGHAVINDLGVSALVERLTSGQPEQSVDLTAQLQALGLLLLQMLLGPQFNPAGQPEDQISQVKNDRVKQLLARLLLPEEWPFENYAELLNELRSFSELNSQLAEAVAESPSVDDGAQAQAKKETEKMVADVRQLVAEKNKLQQSLDEALYNRGLVEKKLKEGEQRLVSAQREIARIKEEANVAWELVGGQKNERWRPVIWAVGGFVVGFLLSGGYGYYYSEQTRNELLSKLQENEELIKTAAWYKQQSESQPTAVSVSPAPPNKAAEPTAEAVAPEPIAAPAEPALMAEVAQNWWPAGSEFSAAAAIPMEQIKAALGFNSGAATGNLPASIRQEVMATVQKWVDSWTRQDLAEYFSCYSENYRPELGRSQEAWREIRRSRLTRPQWIKLDVDDISLRQISDDQIQVRLKQRYRSDFYQDRIIKSINLIKEGGQWRILMERSLGLVERALDDIVVG